MTGISARVTLVFRTFCWIALIWAAPQLRAEQASAEKPANNSLCYVCHKDLASEEIATAHEKVDVTCRVCHGDSTVHMQDEMLMTKPDRLFGRSEVDQMCGACHDADKTHADKAKVEAFRAKWRGLRRPNGRAITAEAVCTDCHGTHNIVREKPGEGDSAQGRKWEAVFNGRDLSGWRQVGRAEWGVHRGRIVGRPQRRGKGGSLLSNAVYGDFLASATFRASWPVRASIWLRTENGENGVRVEILEDRKRRAYTGSISAADKALVLLNVREDLVDKGGWNTLSAEVKGDRYAVWLNGEEIGAVRVTGASKGRIGLAVEKHPKNKNAELSVREILVQQLGEDVSPGISKDDAELMTPLFNGSDLAGWESVGGARWYVKDGELVGVQGQDYAPGDLLTKAKYEDFVLKVTYRVEWPCNSGIWFRYQSEKQAYQADILEYKKPECYSGSLYCPGKMFITMNTDKSLVNRQGWNTMVVRCEGNHLRIWLNDRQVADVRDDTSDSGHIGFQVHPGKGFGAMKIVVREALIRRLGSGTQ